MKQLFSPTTCTAALRFPFLIRSSSSLPNLQPQNPYQQPSPGKKTSWKSAGTLAGRRPSQNPTYPIDFTTRALSEAKALFNSMIDNYRAPPTLHFCKSFLQSYSAISAPRDSIALLRHMIQTIPAVTPDRQTYRILLAQSCKSPDATLSTVGEVLDAMDSGGCPPDPPTIDVAVRTLCSSERGEMAVELIKELSRRGCPPDAPTYGFIVKHMCKFWDFAEVSDFVEEMSESFGIKPDLVIYTILIEHSCNFLDLDEATRLFRSLKDSGFEPDSFVYNAILKGYCVLNKERKAVEFFSQMKKEGFEPNVFTYNALIFGLSKWGKVNTASKLLGIMRGKGLSPNEHTYNGLVNGLCRKGDALRAVAVVEEMQAKGCRPNEFTYNALLAGLCKAGLVGKGMELYGFIKSMGMKLYSEGYGCFMRTLCKEGRVAEAYNVFDYAVESKSLTGDSAYLKLETALKWLKKARKQGYNK